MKANLDENLYSRQLYVLGCDAMTALQSSRILILGQTGLGQEVSKNVILAGVSEVYIYDPRPISENDFGTGYYFTQCGSRRDKNVLNELRELNPYVTVSILEPKISNDNIDIGTDLITSDLLECISSFGFTVVVCCNLSPVDSQLVSNLSVPLIVCDVDGLFSRVFVDFKKGFVVRDSNGEPLIEGTFNDISSEGVMHCIDGERHGFENGDVVRIRLPDNEQCDEFIENKKNNMNEINSYVVEVIDSSTLRLKDYSSGFIQGGTYEQIKVPIVLDHLSLHESKKNPNILETGDIHKLRMIHNIYTLKDEIYKYNNDSVKTSKNESEYNWALDFIKNKKSSFIFKMDEKYDSLIDLFFINKGIEVMAMVSVIGGFVAQEVLKGCTGKFTPLTQFMYFESIEILKYKTKSIENKPQTIKKEESNIAENNINNEFAWIDEYIHFYYRNMQEFIVKENDCKRYSNIINLFGRSILNEFQSSSIFIVGAGAIGCEHLKNIAMSGIGQTGSLFITDMDSIEQSNLNRQFLFRQRDVGKMKSEIAMREIIKMNKLYKSNDNMIYNTLEDTYNNPINNKKSNDNIINNTLEDTSNMTSNNNKSNDNKISNTLEDTYNNPINNKKSNDNIINNTLEDTSNMTTNNKKSNDNIINNTLEDTYKNPTNNKIVENRYKGSQSFALKVGPETENVFTDVFISSLTLIANALDNIEARNYVDSRSILCKIPLFESGTLGTKGNTQVIIPFKTESYSSTIDPPEKSIPLCTLRNFPNLIEHAIEYALSEFKNSFGDKIVSIKEYLKMKRNKLRKIKENVSEESIKQENIGEDIIEMVNKIPTNKNECIENAFSLFYKLFNINIYKLLHAFPPDHKTKEGLPFWVPPKRSPDIIEYDNNNEMHVKFIKSASNLFSFCFSVNDITEKEKNSSITSKDNTNVITNIKSGNIGSDNDIEIADIEKYWNENKNNIKRDVEEKKNYIKNENEKNDEEDKEVENDDDEEEEEENYENTKDFDIEKLKPVEFEKDDDTNHHIDFIYSCSNLRAQNYKIKQGTRLQVKGISGRIIPAIATTTALISGLSVLEMYKYIIQKYSNIKDKQNHISDSQNNKIITKEKYFFEMEDVFKNSFVTLALPFMAQSDPVEPQIQKYWFKDENNTKEFVLWDRIEFNDMKLKELIEYFKKEYETEINMIICSGKVIFSTFYNQEQFERNLDKRFSEIEKIDKERKYLVVDCMFDCECETFPFIVIKVNENY